MPRRKKNYLPVSTIISKTSFLVHVDPTLYDTAMANYRGTPGDACIVVSISGRCRIIETYGQVPRPHTTVRIEVFVEPGAGRFIVMHVYDSIPEELKKYAHIGIGQDVTRSLENRQTGTVQTNLRTGETNTMYANRMDSFLRQSSLNMSLQSVGLLNESYNDDDFEFSIAEPEEAPQESSAEPRQESPEQPLTRKKRKLSDKKKTK